MDEYLKGILNRPGAKSEMHLQYTEGQKQERAQLIELIEAERRAFYDRVEPYFKRLAAIDGVAVSAFVIQVSQGDK